MTHVKVKYLRPINDRYHAYTVVGGDIQQYVLDMDSVGQLINHAETEEPLFMSQHHFKDETVWLQKYVSKSGAIHYVHRDMFN